MALWGFRPLLPAFEMEDPRKDFKKSRVIEQFHLSDRALYIPDKGDTFRWTGSKA